MVMIILAMLQNEQKNMATPNLYLFTLLGFTAQQNGRAFARVASVDVSFPNVGDTNVALRMDKLRFIQFMAP